MGLVGEITAALKLGGLFALYGLREAETSSILATSREYLRKKNPSAHMVSKNIKLLGVHLIHLLKPMYGPLSTMPDRPEPLEPSLW